jgi:hypothetical protein
MAQLYFGQGPLSSALNGVNSILEVITPTPAPTTSNDLLQRCVPETFTPTVFGTEVLALEANVIAAEPAGRQAFCNVTLSYTHPGQNDYIIVETWLPVDDWNGMFLAIGGGGWAAGRQFFSYIDMGESIDDGFATITTDAGLVGNDMESAPWALLSPGNVDLYSLQNTASVSLIDEV